MDIYDDLIKEMNEYLDSKDIQSDSEVVSVRDFKCALEYKLSGVKKAINNPLLIGQSNGRVLRRVRIHKIEEIDITSNGDLSFVIMIELGFNNYVYARAVKYDNNISISYICDSTYIKPVMEKVMPYLEEIFDEIEKCRDLFFSGGYGKDFLASFSADLFQFTISYDTQGNVYISPLRLANARDNDNVGNKLWLSRKSINEVFRENSEELYSKVPLEVSKLSIVYQNAIYEYLKSKNEMKLILN